MNINGKQLEIDIFDADKAEIYEKAQKNVSKLQELMKADLSIGEKIKKACGVICKEIDNLFGKGTSVEIIENKNNLRDCSAVWREITLAVGEQLKADLDVVFGGEKSE